MQQPIPAIAFAGADADVFVLDGTAAAAGPITPRIDRSAGNSVCFDGALI